jgi:hypothetical protein
MLEMGFLCHGGCEVGEVGPGNSLGGIFKTCDRSRSYLALELIDLVINRGEVLYEVYIQELAYSIIIVILIIKTRPL